MSTQAGTCARADMVAGGLGAGLHRFEEVLHFWLLRRRISSHTPPVYKGWRVLPPCMMHPWAGPGWDIGGEARKEPMERLPVGTGMPALRIPLNTTTA